MEKLRQEREVEEIKEEIDELSEKIARRMDELGPEDVIGYRRDPVIRKLLTKICELKLEGISKCEHVDESEVPVCKLFRAEPEIIRRLELSEERICSFYLKKNRPLEYPTKSERQ